MQMGSFFVFFFFTYFKFTEYLYNNIIIKMYTCVITCRKTVKPAIYFHVPIWSKVYTVYYMPSYLCTVCGRMGTQRTAVSQRTRSSETDERSFLRDVWNKKTQTDIEIVAERCFDTVPSST